MNRTLSASAAKALETLLAYALINGLMTDDDIHFCRNQLYAELGAAHPIENPVPDAPPETPSCLLAPLVAFAQEHQLIGDSQAACEAFETRLMGVLMPRPGVVSAEFARVEAADGSREALDWFYHIGEAGDYIRREALSRNIAYTVPFPAGEGAAPHALEITINLAKPEKDPRDIAAERAAPPSGYPRCLLCAENVGYPGHIGHPARQNLRVMPVTLTGEPWYLQYSPYQYYEHHCIVLCGEHRPMGINEEVYERLLSFVHRFPSYFLGSNAGLPVVGGSILSHDHYQGGRHAFPMDSAPELASTQWHGVKVSTLAWPMPCLRLIGAYDKVHRAALAVQRAWLTWNDEALGILSQTDAQHNAITPIAHAQEQPGIYRLDMVLRNNRTDETHPLGIFHPHADKHHIKKENIGLIEVMGCMILPGRLLAELDAVEAALAGHGDAVAPHHEPWLHCLRKCHGKPEPSAAHDIVRHEVAAVCAGVLADAGVYRQTPEGRAGFGRFMGALGIQL